MHKSEVYLTDFIELPPDWCRSRITLEKVQWYIQRGWTVEQIASELRVPENRITRVLQKSKPQKTVCRKPVSTETLPYGWQITSGIVTPHDLEQWVIRRMDEERTKGIKLDRIASDLTKIGIKPKGGGLWFGRRVLKVLKENQRMWAEYRGLESMTL